jgi:hypothetical protein
MGDLMLSVDSLLLSAVYQLEAATVFPGSTAKKMMRFAPGHEAAYRAWRIMMREILL